jgi:pilus assembly protein Flp/PilA
MWLDIALPFSRSARERLRLFAAADDGATAIEYGLIALGIGIAIVVGIDAVGGGLNASFLNIGGLF